MYIIHPRRDENGDPTDKVSIITPTGLLPIEEVARKDVPAGFPYRFVEAGEIPASWVDSDEWVADFSTPDGVGIGNDAWFAEQEALS